MERYDVVIVGGGPAGVSTALKMVELGFKVKIFERKSKSFYKPCGGVLTVACRDLMRYELNLEIPNSLYSKPKTLGLKLISPSLKSVDVENYRLLNIDREKFNKWLLKVAEERGVEISYNATFIDYKLARDSIVSTFKIGKSNLKTVKSKHLIGADGVLSSVRERLYRSLNFNPTFIVQEWWENNSLNSNFYMYFLNENTTPIYGYLIPKREKYILGLGVPLKEKDRIIEYLDRFKECLREEGTLKGKLVRREGWYVPGGVVVEGKNNIVLVGDAGGFCNPLTGEGLRFSVETGVAAAYSLSRSIESLKPLSETYAEEISEIKRFIQQVRILLKNLKGRAREEFIERETSRKMFVA